MNAKADAEFELLRFGIASHEATRALDVARHMRAGFDRLSQSEQKRIFCEAWNLLRDGASR